jgi:hypothetical protein
MPTIEDSSHAVLMLDSRHDTVVALHFPMVTGRLQAHS